MKLPKVYEPKEYEADIYALWEKKGAFIPANRGGEGYFSIVLPPPNANGDLHMGHALTVAIEDALVRYHRLQGREALFVPGADHAGFETWVVYERKLTKDGKSRFDFSREELYTQVWDFVQANKHSFENQLRALGASCDWNYYTFTLDNKVVAQAYQTFKKMWDDGLIYRGKRIVNFCTTHGTSFSDIEVVHEEEKSKLWHIAYPLTDGTGEIVVATTRPETMLGDTAVAVNPKDERYKNLVGKTVKLPLVNREIPIVADSMVDQEFGTGAVKVTPAHDPNDFEVGQRHKLPLIEIITTEGKMSKEVPEKFRGLTVLEARKAVAEALEKVGALKDTVEYTHTVGKCYKCGTIIEPLLREQWFVSIKPLAEKAISALNDKKIKFYPASKREQTIRYLTEVRDWNISRQIAWGIPIPAFQNVDKPDDWIFDTRVNEENIELDGKKYQRDPDVFDTWFSSGQWPYVTLDYPHGDSFKKFYPNTLMETGGEILYQWVARMIMLGLYMTGEIPFENVYIHGYVLAEDKQKMSKSIGNVINPLETIGEYGSDALRMGLLTGRRPGVNQGYHPAKIKAGRNFGNKLWNIARLVEDKIGDDHALRANPLPQTPADHWMLDRLGATTKEISKAFETYRLSEAYELLYHFVWHDLADWYVEASKIQLNKSVLAYSLESVLKLAHPFAPFLTEIVWQTLAWEDDSLLTVQKWPAVPPSDANQTAKFIKVMTVAAEARQISSTLGVKKPTLLFKEAPALAEQAGLLIHLAHLGAANEDNEASHKGIRLTGTDADCWLDIDQTIAHAYLDKLKAQQQERLKIVSNLDARLNNQDYIAKAPANLVEQTRQQLDEENRLLESVKEEIIIFEQAII
jgi:valyl-tRNA synthetase